MDRTYVHKILNSIALGDVSAKRMECENHDSSLSSLLDVITHKKISRYTIRE